MNWNVFNKIIYSFNSIASLADTVMMHYCIVTKVFITLGHNIRY